MNRVARYSATNSQLRRWPRAIAPEWTLARGVPVFYRDPQSKLEIMERPDGHRFEIRYISNAPGEQNYEVIREIAAPAA